ncbi:MAG: hypothetical protein AAGE52_26920 [Myxococcota bacterium]
MAVRRYEASSTVETSFVFECSACGYEGMAAVQGEGYAELDGRTSTGAAETQALDDAEGAAWRDALTTVELAPCPKCGARSASRWRSWLRAQLIGVLSWGALGALLALLGTFLLRQEMDGFPLLVGAIMWPVVSGAILLARVERKRARAATLRFHATE